LIEEPESGRPKNIQVLRIRNIGIRNKMLIVTNVIVTNFSSQVSTISIESLENSMDFSRQENLLELEEGGILSYTMSKVEALLFTFVVLNASID
jgi:hypothetical protein